LNNETTGHTLAVVGKRENKREEILWAGLELMKTRGYNGTSVKDIVDAAGVPKGSFYNYFDSKEAFVLQALEAVAEQENRLEAELLGADGKSPLEKLRHFFDQLVSRFVADEFRVGCFIGNLGQELADSNEPIRREVVKIFESKIRTIGGIIDEAKAAGELSQSVSTETLAEFIFNAWEGTLIRMKTAKSREPLEAFVEMLPRVAG
jgi:TetR/AcrR family transcriptional repressor of nem operon